VKTLRSYRNGVVVGQDIAGVMAVIDYYSRYLLACQLTGSYCAVKAVRALDMARIEAERLCGPLEARR